MKKKKQNPGKLNLLLLISTLIAAILSAFTIYFCHAANFHQAVSGDVYMPLFIGAVFAIYLSVICILVFIISNLKLTYRADVITGRSGKGRTFLYLLLGILVICLFLTGAEILYEQNFHAAGKESGASAYVFLIDDSGTMSSNDPNNMRYSVIESILRDKSSKTRFTVYSFSEDAKLIAPMQTVGDGFPTYPAPDYLLTNMKAGLEKVVSDYEQGVWTNKGGTSLILITDGGPTDFASFSEVQSILDRCISHNITLGIVGVIGANNSLMNEMATYTGGTFTDINDISMLNEAVRTVSGGAGFTRDLLSERDEVEMDWLYALIRVLSIAIAGSLFAVTAALCYGNSTAFSFIVWANVIKSVVAGILMEVAFLLPGISQILCILSLILLGTILSKYGDTEEYVVKDSGYLDFFDTPAKGPSSFR